MSGEGDKSSEHKLHASDARLELTSEAVPNIEQAVKPKQEESLQMQVLMPPREGPSNAPANGDEKKEQEQPEQPLPEEEPVRADQRLKDLIERQMNQ